MAKKNLTSRLTCNFTPRNGKKTQTEVEKANVTNSILWTNAALDILVFDDERLIARMDSKDIKDALRFGGDSSLGVP